MNTIKKNLTYIVAFLLALGFASLANAEANNVSDLVDGVSVTQSLDLNQQQTDVQQSVLPSCGSDVQDAVASSTGLNPNVSPAAEDFCPCCKETGDAWCCNSCNEKTLLIDTDAS